MQGRISAFFLVLVLFAGFQTSLVSAAEMRARNYRDVKSFLNSLAAKYPDTAKVIQLGPSDSGDTIMGVALGEGPVSNLVVATHHGNEYGSTEVAKAFATALAQTPIPGQKVYVIPVLNIRGYNNNQRGEVAGKYSYDANRDYPGPCGSEGPFKLKSTSALAKFVGQEKIVTAATLHTYYPAVVYPWGFSTRDISTPYDDLFKQLVRDATRESHYRTGNSSEVIYPANGTFEDYAFWQHGAWSILFELGETHQPSQDEIAEMIQVNVPGLRRLMENSPTKPAENHAFTGRCDDDMRRLDRHDE